MRPSDKPTSVDQLGFEPYVKGIENLIRQTDSESLPLAIGIYGAWGSGKTSFMLQLKSRLETKGDGPPLPIVWFDAWKYDRIQDVRSALIYKILFDLQTAASAGTKSKLSKAIQELGTFTLGVIEQSNIRLDVPVGGGISLPSIQDVKKHTQYWKGYQTIVDRFASEFGKAVEGFLAQRQDRQEGKLIVFIDDLDRCLPENVIVVLEALKLFLVEARCVFVIGVDRAVVERAVQAHYNADLSDLGKEYLDKIVKCPFNIPVPEPAKLKEYFGQLTQPNSLNDKCLYVLQSAAEGNPRIYLRLVNAWNLVSNLAPYVIPPLWEEDHKHTLAIATAVHIRFPAFHEVCCGNLEGLYQFVSYCFDAPAQDMYTLFSRAGRVEYAEFWGNAAIRRFCRGLNALEPRRDLEKILGPLGLVKSAFNLSEHVA